jgi:hypothetical protein
MASSRSFVLFLFFAIVLLAQHAPDFADFNDEIRQRAHDSQDVVSIDQRFLRGFHEASVPGAARGSKMSAADGASRAAVRGRR